MNVNPFDTGYQENSTVMEFAALASEVTTVTTKVASHTVIRKTVVATEVPEIPTARVRQVRVSVAGGRGEPTVEKVFDIVEGKCFCCCWWPLPIESVHLCRERRAGG